MPVLARWICLSLLCLRLFSLLHRNLIQVYPFLAKRCRLKCWRTNRLIWKPGDKLKRIKLPSVNEPGLFPTHHLRCLLRKLQLFCWRLARTCPGTQTLRFHLQLTPDCKFLLHLSYMLHSCWFSHRQEMDPWLDWWSFDTNIICSAFNSGTVVYWAFTHVEFPKFGWLDGFWLSS